MTEESNIGTVPLTAKKIEYCPHCSFPPEFCEFGNKWNDCKVFLQDKYPEIYIQLNDLRISSGKEKPKAEESQKVEETTKSNDKDEGAEDGAKEEEVDDLLFKPLSKKDTKDICIYSKDRSRRKFVTYILGIENVGLKPKDVAKVLAKRFATSASVGDEGITLNGDLVYDIADYLMEEYSAINESMFTTLQKGNIKKKLFR